MNAPRAMCLRCRRPRVVCWCSSLPSLDTAVRLCFLQHPRETKVAIGTARMAHLSLPNSELHVGVAFDEHPRVRELAAQPGTALLFPGEGSTDAAALSPAPRTLVVLDGTWHQARKLLAQNPRLRALPRVGFQPRRPSNYRIRREPEDHCVSTIEAVVHALEALEKKPKAFDPLLRPFDRMVDLQLAYAARGEGPPRRRQLRGPRPPRPDRAAEELRARRGSLVAVYAESARGAEAGDGVVPRLLQLLALRLGEDRPFEAFVAPERPLPPEVALWTELSPERLAGGEPVGEAVGEVLARFRGFLRPGDALVGWGAYAARLLAAEGLEPLPFLDLRIAAMRRLNRRPAGVEQAVRLLGGADLPPSAGEGRGGRRLACLAAVAKALVA